MELKIGDYFRATENTNIHTIRYFKERTNGWDIIAEIHDGMRMFNGEKTGAWLTSRFDNGDFEIIPKGLIDTEIGQLIWS